MHLKRKDTWFARIPDPKDRIRAPTSNESGTFTANIDAVDHFPTVLYEVRSKLQVKILIRYFILTLNIFALYLYGVKINKDMDIGPHIVDA